MLAGVDPNRFASPSMGPTEEMAGTVAVLTVAV